VQPCDRQIEEATVTIGGAGQYEHVDHSVPQLAHVSLRISTDLPFPVEAEREQAAQDPEERPREDQGNGEPHVVCER